jgi:hypothetical protein
MKHEWRKHEKAFYLPKPEPTRIDIPAFRFFTLAGTGNPNSDHFAEYIGVLYSLAYAVKMSPKKGLAPAGYFDYTVYPLEGVWDLSEEGRQNYTGTLDKDQLVFRLMIRQPDFVDAAFAERMIAATRKKKPHELLDHVRFEIIEEGTCVQMLHRGSYDSEPASFARMEEFATEAGWTRVSKQHREIYLNDARKTAPEKLRTVLRFRVTGPEGR